MPFKMIVTDLDGTLLHSDKSISSYTKRVLERCRARGMKVVYATARGISANIAPSELFDGYIRSNGATAYIGDTLVYQRYMPMERIRGLLLAAEQAGLNIVAVSNGLRYANYDATAHWPWAPHYEVADFQCLNIDIGEIYTMTETPQQQEMIKENLLDGLYLYASHDGFTMITHEDAMKHKAIAVLARHWGIEQADIVAFGDDFNDIDMLTYAGTSVAMGNAIEDVKNIAEAVCGGNDEDGVAKWLEENLCLSN